MSIAISEEHRALAQTVAWPADQAPVPRGGAQPARRRDRTAARLLGRAQRPRPARAARAGRTRRLGLRLAETLVVAEQMGRHLAPGPFVPTVIASAVLAAAGPDDLRKRLLPGLADGSVIGAAALGGEVAFADGAATGQAGVVLSGHLADVLLVPAGEGRAGGREVGGRGAGRGAEEPGPEPAGGPGQPGRGPGPRCLPGCARASRRRGPGRARGRGGRRRCRDHGDGDRVREGPRAVRPARSRPSRRSSTTARTCWWPPTGGRCRVGHGPGRERRAAASSATPRPSRRRWPCRPRSATPTSTSRCTAGIGFTWEHDATLYLRRAAAIAAVADTEQAAIEVTAWSAAACSGRQRSTCPPRRSRSGGDQAGCGAAARPDGGGEKAGDDRIRLRDAALAEAVGPGRGRHRATGHRAEFAAAGIKRPAYGITSWIILTLIQHASPARWRAGSARAQPGRHLVPAVQRAGRRVGRGRHQDQGDQDREGGGGRVADQRPEGLDQRRARGQLRPGYGADQPGRAQAPGHHHDGDRHARARCPPSGR